MAKRKSTSRKKTTKKASKISIPRIRKIMYTTSETKFNDQTLTTGPSLTTWGFASPCFFIQQGTAANQRIGNKIYVKSIQFSCYMVPLVTMTGAGVLCRFVVYHNKETVGALPTGLRIFVSDDVRSLRNTSNVPRFSILRDMTHSMVITSTNAATVNGVGPTKLVQFTIYPKKVIDFTGTTGTIADLLKHDYGIGFCCSQAAACNVDVICKVQYSDA